MDILKMTDLEIYELGTKKLTEQMGTAYAAQFLQKCKSRDYDYTAERHKWLADDPDILTMAKQIQEAKALQAKEERVKAERIAAWRNGLLELTDIEIYELGLKVLADSLGAYGLLRFITQHFKHLRDNQSIGLPRRSLIENLRFSVDPSAFSDFKERVSWSGKLGTTSAFYGRDDLMKQNRENP